MNVIKVLILPRKNEVMPFVTVEAQKYGTHVVGSDRGGIPGVIPQKNVSLSERIFKKKFAGRVIEILQEDEKLPPFPKGFNWEEAINKKLKLYKKIIENCH